jgi:hypothetical protein
VGGRPLFEWRPDQPFAPADAEGAAVDIVDDDATGDGDVNVWATGANIADPADATGAWDEYNDGGVEPAA